MVSNLRSYITSKVAAASRPSASWALLAVPIVSIMGATALTATPAASAAPSTTARYIVVLKDSTQNPEATAKQQGRRLGFQPTHVYGHAISGYVASMTAKSAAALRTDPTVQFVTADRVFARMPKQIEPIRCEVKTGPRQCVDDWVNRVDAEQSSTRSGDGRGSVDVNTAVIDSGIEASHQDLDVRGGVNCSSGAPAPVPHPVDPVGHGTHVAGLIAAKDNGIGVVGVAPGTPLWSVSVVDNETDEITLSALVCAVDWVTATRQDRDRRNDIAIANISILGENTDDGLCGLSNQDPFHLAICHSVAAGITYAVAAGNDSTDFAQFSPANFEQVLTVTAMADFDGKPGGAEPPDCYGFDLGGFGAGDDVVAPFSDYATQPEDEGHTLAAPGVCMQSTLPRLPGYFGYGVLDGTSMASPVVAGTVALCMQTGQCSKSDPVATMKRILNDAAAYNAAHPTYGFEGDPLRPIAGRYYGFLVHAGTY